MGFKNIGLRAKIILGSCITLVLMVVVGIIAINSTNSLTMTNKWVDHTYEVIASANKILATAVDMETGMRGYLLTGKDAFLDPYMAGRKNFKKLVVSLQKTVDDDPAQVQLLEEAGATIAEWQEKVTEPTIELRKEIGDAKTMNDMAKLVGQEKGKVYFSKFRNQIAAFIDKEQKALIERKMDGKSAADNLTSNILTMNKSSKWVIYTYKVIAKIDAALAAIVDMETGMRGYLLTGDEEFLRPYKRGIQNFDSTIKQIQELVSNNPEQVKRLKELDKVHDEWQESVTRPAIDLRRKVVGGDKNMSYVVKLASYSKETKYVDEIRKRITDFKKVELDNMAKRQNASEAAASATETNIEELNNTTERVDRTHEVIESAQKILNAAVDMETGMRGYLLAGKEDFLDPYKAGKERFSELVSSLAKTVGDDPELVQLLGEAKATIDEWQEKVTEPTIALRRDIGDAKTMDDMADLVGEARGKVFFDKFRGQMVTFIDREQKLMHERQTAADSTADSSGYMIIGGIISAALLSMLISLVLANSITRPFKQIFQGLKSFSSGELDKVRGQFWEVIEGLSNGSGQVASASQQMASGASQQAASLEETSSSLEEMSTMTKANADNANQADSLTKDTNRVIDQANSSMGDLTRSMEEITKASEETSKIVKTIDEIAFQTNLLALNAAVEAARAGEAGAGFAVVADEVRNLAMRAADAAKNTANLIEGTVKKVKEGSDLVTKTNEAFSEVSNSSTRVGELVGEISAASNEQAQGINQVNNAVAEMDKIVQANASGTEELSSQSNELNSMVEILLEIVEGKRDVREKSESGGIQPEVSQRAALTAPVKRSKGKGVAVHKGKSEIGRTSGGEVSPEEIIPMDDDFRDF